MQIHREIKAKIEETIQSKAAHVTGGHCRGLEEYRGWCGELIGLAKALRVVDQCFAEINQKEAQEESEWR